MFVSDQVEEDLATWFRSLHINFECKYSNKFECKIIIKLIEIYVLDGGHYHVLCVLVQLHNLVDKLAFAFAVDRAAEHQLQKVAQLNVHIGAARRFEYDTQCRHRESRQRVIQHFRVVVGQRLEYFF